MAKREIRQIRVEGNFAYVTLTQGYEAVIDASDVALIDAWDWSVRIHRRADGSIRQAYAVRTQKAGGVNHQVSMHRALMGEPKGFEVDHQDCNGLNNCRSNLRTATKSQNMHNMRTPVRNTSGVKGVSWSKAAGKWRAEIKMDGTLRHLSHWATIDDAAEAYRRASESIHGEFGRTE